MFVLRLSDPQSSHCVYLTKIGPTGATTLDFFGNSESLFDTEQEAIDYIKDLIDSGWYRGDISESNFTVVTLIWDNGFWVTEEAYRRHRTPNAKIQKLVEDLIALRNRGS